jgi:hypothetical protein
MIAKTTHPSSAADAGSNDAHTARQRGSGGGAMGATATVCWGEARWSLATPIAGLEHGAPGANAAAETAERTTMNLIEDVAD